MESKTSKDQQASLLREVMAQFDIETKVQHIALRSFESLLKGNKQAFAFISESQQKLIMFEERLNRAEGFAHAIEASVTTRTQITDNLSKRLEIFATEFHEAMKSNTSSVIEVRKDLDVSMGLAVRHTNEIRAIDSLLAKTNQEIERINLNVNQDIRSMIEKNSVQFRALNEELAKRRGQTEEILTKVAVAKAQLDSSSTFLHDVSQDMALYKSDKLSISNRLNDLLNQMEDKLLKSQFYRTRLEFDNQFITLREKNEVSLAALKKEVEIEAKTRSMEHNSATSLIQQTQRKLEELREKVHLLNQSQDTQRQKLGVAVNEKILHLTTSSNDRFLLAQRALDDQSMLTAHRNTLTEKAFAESNKRIVALQNEAVSLANRTTEVESNILSINDLIREMQSGEEDKLRNAESSAQETGAFMQQINKISINFLALQQDVIKCKQTIGKVAQLHAPIEKQCDTNTAKILELRRSMDSSSIAIMASVTQAEKESKAYTDRLGDDLRDRLILLDSVSKEMEGLKQIFRAQMAQTEAVNSSIADKMQKTVAMQTKLKGDLAMRVQAVSAQQQRRSIQMRQNMKYVDEMRKGLSIVYEASTILLSVALANENSKEEIKDIVKISSLIEGWVLEMDEKGVKYRGEIMQKRKLLAMTLSYLVGLGEKLKAALLQNGKELYSKMIDMNSSEAFNRRKLSKRGQSELPKLHT